MYVDVQLKMGEMYVDGQLQALSRGLASAVFLSSSESSSICILPLIDCRDKIAKLTSQKTNLARGVEQCDLTWAKLV